MRYVFLLLIINNVFASDFELTTADAFYSWQISDESSVLNCSGFHINFNTSNPTNPVCNNNVVHDGTIVNSSGICPMISVDGILYEFSFDLIINHISKLILVDSSPISNCLNGSGQPPNFGTSFILIIGAVVIGIADIKFNYNTWVLEMISLDGDVVCEGSFIDDLIFEHNFEN